MKMKKVTATAVIAGALTLTGAMSANSKNANNIVKDADTSIKHTITLNTNGGYCDTTSIKVQDGDFANLPTPTKEGHVFLGWFINGERADTYIVNSDLTYEAMWVPNEFVNESYSVEYVFNIKGASKKATTIKGNPGADYTFKGKILSAPTVKGYKFDKWEDAATPGTAITDPYTRALPAAGEKIVFNGYYSAIERIVTHDVIAATPDIELVEAPETATIENDLVLKFKTPTSVGNNYYFKIEIGNKMPLIEGEYTATHVTEGDKTLHTITVPKKLILENISVVYGAGEMQEHNITYHYPTSGVEGIETPSKCKSTDDVKMTFKYEQHLEISNVRVEIGNDFVVPHLDIDKTNRKVGVVVKSVDLFKHIGEMHVYVSATSVKYNVSVSFNENVFKITKTPEILKPTYASGYTIEFDAISTYKFYEKTFNIHMGGKELVKDTDYTLEIEDGLTHAKLVIKPNVINSDVSIELKEFYTGKYKINFNFEHVKHTGASEVDSSKDTAVTLVPDDGYQIPADPEKFEITNLVGQEEKRIYPKIMNSIITFPAGLVQGDVTIKFTAEVVQHSLTLKNNDLIDSPSKMPTTVNIESKDVLKFTLQEDYRGKARMPEIEKLKVYVGDMQNPKKFSEYIDAVREDDNTIILTLKEGKFNGDTVIDFYGVERYTYKVLTELDGLTLEGAAEAKYKVDYTATLKITDGTHYHLPLNIAIKCDGKELTRDTQYTYNNQTGEIKIFGTSITNDLTIVASKEATKRKVTQNFDAKYIKIEEGAPTEADFEHDFVAAYFTTDDTRYSLDTPTVKIGGKEETSFTWKRDESYTKAARFVLTIPKELICGDIEINSKSTINEYTVTTRKFDFKYLSTNIPSKAVADNDFVGSYEVKEEYYGKYYLGGAKPTIKVGGKVISDVSWSETLNSNGSVIGRKFTIPKERVNAEVYIECHETEDEKCYEHHKVVLEDVATGGVWATEKTTEVQYDVKDYTAKFTPYSGYYLSKDLIQVKREVPHKNETNDVEFTYDSATNTLTIKKDQLFGNISVTAKPEYKTYSAEVVDANDAIEAEGSIIFTKEGTFTLKVKDAKAAQYALPEKLDSVIAIKDDGTEVTLQEGRDYDYHPVEGKLHITAEGSVGKIKINSTSVLRRYNLIKDVVDDCAQVNVISSPARPVYGQECKIEVARELYFKDMKIESIKSGSRVLTPDTEYTIEDKSGDYSLVIITINAASVQGDITVRVSATKL